MGCQSLRPSRTHFDLLLGWVAPSCTCFAIWTSARCVRGGWMPFVRRAAEAHKAWLCCTLGRLLSVSSCSRNQDALVRRVCVSFWRTFPTGTCRFGRRASLNCMAVSVFSHVHAMAGRFPWASSARPRCSCVVVVVTYARRATAACIHRPCVRCGRRCICCVVDAHGVFFLAIYIRLFRAICLLSKYFHRVALFSLGWA